MPVSAARLFGVMILVWGLCGIAAVSADEPAVPRVLLLADESTELPTLDRLLKEHGYDVTHAGQAECPDRLEPFDAVFMYIHKTLRPEVETALIDYARGGGRLIVLHHGIASGKIASPKWMNFLGVSIAPRGAPQYAWDVSGNVTHRMVNLKPGHFITTSGIEYEKTVDYVSADRPELSGSRQAFDLPDTEVFHNQRHTDGTAKTLLFGFQLEKPDETVVTEETSGWMKPVEKGLLFYFQAGHAEHDFANPNFGRVLLNSLQYEPEKSGE